MSLGGAHTIANKRSPRLVRCVCSDREPRRAADPLGFYLGRGIEVVAGPSLLFSVEWVGESGSGGGARSVWSPGGLSPSGCRWGVKQGLPRKARGVQNFFKHGLISLGGVHTVSNKRPPRQDMLAGRGSARLRSLLRYRSMGRSGPLVFLPQNGLSTVIGACA